MKIAPLKVSDPWYGRILNDGRVQAESLRSVPIESTVEMELVELLHGGPEENYRPYLHLRGELTEAVPEVELPYGVSELVLRRGAGLNVDAFYDFSQRQLRELVNKGYFTDQFQVPGEMTGIPWAIPGSADFLVVAPEYSDQPPVVFMNVHEQNEMELDEENSGYDLSEYFPDYVQQSQDLVEAAKGADAPEYGGSGRDIFSDVVFDEHRPIQERTPEGAGTGQDSREPVPSGIFERLMSEIDARRVVEPEFIEEQEPEPEAIVPGSAADLYLSRVSPGVDQVLSRGHLAVEESMEAERFDEPQDEDSENADERDREPSREESSVAAKVFLDLSEPEPELTPPGVRTQGDGKDDPEAHRKAAVRRTARIRSELTGDGASSAGSEAQVDL